MGDLENAGAELWRSHGLEDMRPHYREMLRRLRDTDRRSFDGVVAEWESRVKGKETPESLEAWISWAAALAQQIEAGDLKCISASGLAETAPDPAPVGPMLLHLPENTTRKGLVIAFPSEASPAQRVTAELLC